MLKNFFGYLGLIKLFLCWIMLEIKFLFSSGLPPEMIFLKTNFVKLSIAGSYINFC